MKRWLEVRGGSGKVGTGQCAGIMPIFLEIYTLIYIYIYKHTHTNTHDTGLVTFAGTGTVPLLH